jgi:hypothetical protein
MLIDVIIPQTGKKGRIEQQVKTMVSALCLFFFIFEYTLFNQPVCLWRLYDHYSCSIHRLLT